MGLILDTCIFIKAEKKAAEVEFKKWDSYGDAYISAITVSELLVGVHYANSESYKQKRSNFVENIINSLTTLAFTPEVARVHSELYATLAKQGKLIGAHDLIIGATALTYAYPVLTTNQQEFKRIPGLTVLEL